MIKSLSVALCLALTTMATAQTSYSVDPAGTALVWTGKKVTGQHKGNINVRSGTLVWGPTGLSNADITIDMTSITDVDMEGESAAELEGQLKSPDFFNTEAYKTANFKATKVEPIAGAEKGEPNYTVTGDLTIKGITKPVTFTVLASQEKRIVRATGTITFDRTLYDIKFRSGNFFQNLGDKLIEDTVELSFKLVAK